jgi:hypothetical protein
MLAEETNILINKQWEKIDTLSDTATRIYPLYLEMEPWYKSRCGMARHWVKMLRLTQKFLSGFSFRKVEKKVLKILCL